VVLPDEPSVNARRAADVRQLLMVSGFDPRHADCEMFPGREDPRPTAEFTQIDCEMSPVTQEDILRTF